MASGGGALVSRLLRSTLRLHESEAGSALYVRRFGEVRDIDTKRNERPAEKWGRDSQLPVRRPSLKIAGPR
jgi:hypothetical protein